MQPGILWNPGGEQKLCEHAMFNSCSGEEKKGERPLSLKPSLA